MRQFLESVVFFQISTCRFSPVNKRIPQLIDLSTAQRFKKFAVFAVLMLCLFVVQWYMFVNCKYIALAKFTRLQPNNRITTRSWGWHRKFPLARSRELTKVFERQTNLTTSDIKPTIVWRKVTAETSTLGLEALSNSTTQDKTSSLTGDFASRLRSTWCLHSYREVWVQWSRSQV